MHHNHINLKFFEKKQMIQLQTQVAYISFYYDYTTKKEAPWVDIVKNVPFGLVKSLKNLLIRVTGAQVFSWTIFVMLKMMQRGYFWS